MWKVQLDGNSGDLKNLVESFTGPDITVIHEGDGFLLWSAAFSDDDDANAIKEKANAIIARLNGACLLGLSSLQQIQLGPAYEYGDDGKRKTIVAFMEPARLGFRVLQPTVRITRQDGTVEVSHPADGVQRWTALAGHDLNVDKVLRILATHLLDWRNLYFVYEVINKDVKRGGIVSRGWATEKSLNLFKRTANHPESAGLDARHGVSNQQPPKNPMSISDARLLIRSIAVAWLSQKS